MKTCVLDFDDLTDTNNPIDTLLIMKTRTLDSRSRSSPSPRVALTKFMRHITNCVTGFNLASTAGVMLRHECLGWTSEETEDKLKRATAIYPGFAKVFKAPNWEIDSGNLQRLQRSWLRCGRPYP